MKKLLLIIACVMFTAGTASAVPIGFPIEMRLNPDAALGTNFGTTGVFTQVGIYAQTTSTDVNGSFSDVGNIAVQSLIHNTPVGRAGLDSDWFMVGGWDNLQGINPSPGEFIYTSGTLNLYATQTPYDFGPSIGAGDGSGFSTGVLVATLELNQGLGFIVPGVGGERTPFQGTIDMRWDFTYMMEDFWLLADGTPIPFEELPPGFVFAMVDANTNNIIFDGNNILSDHNGSVQIGIIPEPATMALFGTGLFGLAGAGIKKKKVA